MKQQYGFTLLELVAALAIFAVMSVMAYGNLDAVMRSRDGLEANYNRVEQWQRAVHRLRQDIEQARPRSIRDEFGDAQPALWLPEEGRIELSRGGRANPLLQRRANLERIALYLDDDKLKRASWSVLDRTQGLEPQIITLLTDITALRWRFLPAKAGGGAQWDEVWPPDNRTGLGTAGLADSPLPAAVELELESKAMGPVRLLFLIGGPA